MANVSDMRQSTSWVGLSQAWSNLRLARKLLLNLLQITSNPLRGWEEEFAILVAGKWS